MSADLSWRKHYDFISSCVYKTLGLLHRALNTTNSVHVKKLLYLIYPCFAHNSLTAPSSGSPTYIRISSCWRRSKDGQFNPIHTKLLLFYSSSDYESRLVSLQMLPLMMLCELNDIIFFNQIALIKKMISLSSQSIIELTEHHQREHLEKT